MPADHPAAIGAGLGLGVLAASTMLYAPSGPQLAQLHAAPTLAVAEPSFFDGLVDDPAGADALRVGVAAGPIRAKTAKAIHDALGARVRGGLALDCVSGLVHADPVYGRSKPGSVGLALTDVHTAVHDSNGNVVEPGATGVLSVRGPQTAEQCWSDAACVPGSSSQVAGRFDDDGYLWLQ